MQAGQMKKFGMMMDIRIASDDDDNDAGNEKTAVPRRLLTDDRNGGDQP